MAMLLELRYSKKQLLTGYVNEIYLGQDGDRAIHGFGLASRFYFGKPLDELDLAETALLVGIVRGPSYYNPRTQPERATLRRNLVLAKLAELAVVTDADAAAAAKQPLGVVPRVSRASHYAYLDLVRRELRRDYGEETLKAPGLQVYTHLDPRTQAAAERAVRDRVSRLEVKDKTRKGALEAALVVTLPASGEVVAMVGGRNEQAAGFNRALDARRPIGSLVKPIVYLAALETGKYHAATILNDGPVEVRFGDGKNWRPQNFDRETLGPLPLVRAIAESRNLADGAARTRGRAGAGRTQVSRARARSRTGASAITAAWRRRDDTHRGGAGLRNVCIGRHSSPAGRHPRRSHGGWPSARWATA